MLMTTQPPGGPQAALAQSALQPIPVSTTAHFPYMTHPSGEACVCRGRRAPQSILLAQVEWQAGPVLEAPHLRTSKTCQSVHSRDCDDQLSVRAWGSREPRLCVFWWHTGSGLMRSSSSILCSWCMLRTQLAFLVTLGWTGQCFPSWVPTVWRGGLPPWQSLIVPLETTTDEKVLCMDWFWL